MSYVVASSPHMLDPDSTPSVMRWVCLALAPAMVWGWYAYGLTAPLVALSCVAACLATEEICCRLRKIPSTLGDWSAVVTGLLLACVLPSNIPLWLAALGGVFAIGIGKQAFGGLGANIWNPALLARAFLQNSRPTEMMSGDYPWLSKDMAWYKHFGVWLSGSFAEINAIATAPADAVSRASPPSDDMAEAAATAAQRAVESGAEVMTAATALTAIHYPPALADGTPPKALLDAWNSPSVVRTWLGFEGGNIGEGSAVLLLLGGLVLLWKRIITWETPVAFLGVVALLGWMLPHPYRLGDETVFMSWFSGPWLLHLGGGGLMIGAWFMATDLVTGPLTRKGKFVFGVGCGILTMMIRLYGGYPEGVCYSILLMNTCVPLIDQWTRPRVFGKP